MAEVWNQKFAALLEFAALWFRISGSSLARLLGDEINGVEMCK